jgi:hypothetical protein
MNLSDAIQKVMKGAITEASEVGGGATGISKSADPTGVKAQAPGNSKDQGDKTVINPPEHNLPLGGEETDSENNSAPVGASADQNRSTITARGGSMKEHVNAMFEGENLSEEFKEKAEAIFEAAITSRVSEIAEEMEVEVNKNLAEAYTQLQEEAVQQLADLTEKLDDYLNYAVKSWMDDNQIAIEHSLRTEVTEDFINGMRNLFAENYIDIPNDRLDVVEELAAKVEELEAKLNEAVSDNIELTNALNEMASDEIFTEVSEGLAATQVEKLRKLTEGVEFDAPENYKKKLQIVKENYFTKVTETPTTGLLEESFDGDEVEARPTGRMNKYVQAISKTAK